MGNGGNAYASNVRVIDKLYRNGTDLLLNEYEETFESIGPGSRNVFQYNFEFNETGRYYHNALLYINDELKMSSISGLTRVKDAYEEGCCIDEGNAPEEDEVCCMSGERRPLDYGNAESGRCGCPDPLEWIDGECKYPRATCYGNPNLGLCNKDPRQNFAQWLEDVNCLKNFLGITGGDKPYQYGCCPYVVGGNYDDVWAFDLPDSQIQVY